MKNTINPPVQMESSERRGWFTFRQPLVPLPKILDRHFTVSGASISFSQGSLARAAEKPMDLSTAIIQVAKQNIPAVVHIEVTERQEVVNPLLALREGPFLPAVFRHSPRCPRNSRGS